MGTSVARISAVAILCVTASLGCSRSDEAEIAKLKAEVESAKAEASKEKARADAAVAEIVKAQERADAANGEAAKAKEPQARTSAERDVRKAAEWVLSISGIVKVVANNTLIEIHGPDGKLPAEPFEIAEIKLPGGNAVTNDNIEIISGLKSVVLVNATGNKLTEFSFLKGMNNLRHFNGHDTDLDDACLGYLKDCPKMESLDLGSNYQNHVTDDGLQSVQDMKFLTFLDILGTRTTDVGLGYIKGLTNLTYLAMGNHGIRTDISDVGIANLAALKKLETLIIVNAAVTDSSLDHIKKLGNLKRVHLAKTDVTEAGAESLKVALPNCKVEYSK